LIIRSGFLLFNAFLSTLCTPIFVDTLKTKMIMSPKDLFSGHAKLYAAFRPTYPESLFQFIFQHVTKCNEAWDCATGNGQVAQHLSKHFQKVYATDISQQQLENAIHADNIVYSQHAAEKTALPENAIDLITVGQALHWFDREKFYAEVNRVGRTNALLAVWGYALLYVEPEIDKIIMDFYSTTVGPYWDDARKLVEQQYQTITFPFDEIETPDFFIEADWNFAQLTGYLESWSATQKFIQANSVNPVLQLTEKLKPYWPVQEIKHVRFPIFLRLGRVKK